MTVWKRLAPLSLSVVLAVGAPMAATAASPEFAKTPEEWERLRDDVLEYDELADLIHEYNTTVAANRIQYEKTRGKSVEDITRQYSDAASSYGQQAYEAESDMEAVAAELNERRAEIAAEDNVDDGENDRLAYAQVEASLVMLAQTYMYDYHLTKLQISLEESNQSFQERLLQSAYARQSAGTVTTADILDAQQSVQSSAASIISLNAQLESTSQSLATMTGWKQNNIPEIRELPAVDFNRIAAMNPAVDKEVALANDYGLQAQRRRLEHSQSTENISLYTTNIKSLEEKAKASVDQCYQNVQVMKTTYEQAELALVVANNNLNAGQRMLSVGMASQTEVAALEYVQQAAEMSFKTAELGLFQVMQLYDWMLNGLATL